MIWIILLLILLLPVAWILLMPFQFEMDTRIPVIMIQWKSIGNATLFYEEEVWWLQIRVGFFSKKWNFVQMIFADRKKRKKGVQSRKRSGAKKRMPLLKFFKILKTFQIVHWEIAFDANDNAVNAWWYWLNFFPFSREHIHVNFFDEDYFVLVIRNKVWRIAYAFMK
jgi:hypothetical protein